MTQAAAIVETLKTLAEIIRTAGRIPSGHLYAQLAGLYTLDQYNAFIGVLKRAGLVKESGFYELLWIGPQPQEATA